jgi:putative hydrolase of the HAD superfamily
LACEALSVEPFRCLYVGDGGSHELTGAVQVGMDAVLLSVEAEGDLDPYRPDAPTWTGPVIGSLSELVEALSQDGRLTRRCR